MEDEDFGDNLSVSFSMMRQPLPASIDLDNLSEKSVQFVDDVSVPVHLPESLESVDHGFRLPDFEDKRFVMMMMIFRMQVVLYLVST